jgi:Uncharacterized conserved protein
MSSNKGIAVGMEDIAGGQQLAGGQNTFFVRGKLAVVKGDPVMPHGEPPHDMPIMIEASDKFFIQGKPVCREGDHASCGHTTTGRPFFLIP